VYQSTSLDVPTELDLLLGFSPCKQRATAKADFVAVLCGTTEVVP